MLGVGVGQTRGTPIPLLAHGGHDTVVRIVRIKVNLQAMDLRLVRETRRVFDLLRFEISRYAVQ